MAFHRGHITEAKKLISSTKTELNSLRVSDEDLGEVIANGFTEREARMALRFVKYAHYMITLCNTLICLEANQRHLIAETIFSSFPRSDALVLALNP